MKPKRDGSRWSVSNACVGCALLCALSGSGCGSARDSDEAPQATEQTSGEDAGSARDHERDAAAEPLDAASADDASAVEPDAASPSQDAGSDVAADDSITSDCPAKLCMASSPQLADYCSLEHARCPKTLEQARERACAHEFAFGRERARNGCAGESIRVLLDHGDQLFHFDEGGALVAVTTLANMVSERCITDIYHYGEPACLSLRTSEVLRCDP